MENGNLPKMENPYELYDWFYAEDYCHLPSSFDQAPTIPTIPYSNFNPNSSINYFLEHPNIFSTQNLDNFPEDFHLWSEYPPLTEETLETLTLIPPAVSFPIEYNSAKSPTFENNGHFLTDFGGNNDQTLDVIVAEGLNMTAQQSAHETLTDEEKFVNGDYVKMEKLKRVKGENLKMKIDSISYEEIRKYFNVPISKAAKELNVGLTVLKKRCRELNIKRWPHRKIKSLEGLISNVKEEQGMMEMVKLLEEYKRKLHFVPSLELDEDTKRIRQQFFKANYKKRRALALNTAHA